MLLCRVREDRSTLQRSGHGWLAACVPRRQLAAPPIPTLRHHTRPRGASTSIGDEGGFPRSLPSNAAAIEVIPETIARTGYAPGKDCWLALIVGASGVLSALFLNDIVVLMLDTTRALKRDPILNLLGLATSANVGAVAAITGNPQNIVIGTASQIPYLAFTTALASTALLGLVICWGVVVLTYRRELRSGTFVVPDVRRSRPLRGQLLKSAVALPLMLVLFLLNAPVPLAAFHAAGVMLATRRLKPECVFATVDWPLLVFFAGLFAVTGSLKVQGLTTQLFALLAPVARAGLVPFGLATAVLSNLVSNVPAVLLLQGLVPALANPQRGWLILAAASTLAGNLALLGSVANLIVAEVATHWSVRISFGAYLRIELPPIIATLLVTFVLV